ncbi:sulfotransferase [Acuticoccus sp. MNP-M23]|uniref:tetratricopeptide repeat-containing sulfotransferase family protein n=1 Tax=Acuticoccus sp. MNP-M23 TaxID=3072793 RepID=UPI002814D8A1|nr:sulfotransferase [Acuticoccus sp. MNP-M23]WMS43638.1 sulfotransferase [Acuticoccus sp. MNP-M23]
MLNSLPPDRAIARAKSLAKRGETDAARALLVDGIRRFPKNRRLESVLRKIDMPAVPPRPAALAGEVKRLRTLLEARDCDAAIALGTQLAKALPDDVFVLVLLGFALVEAQRPSEALPLFKAVIQQAPTYSRGWVGFGTALAESNHHRQATVALNQALALSPGDIGALNNLGSSLRNIDRHEDALRCFRSVQEREDGPQVRKNIGTTLLELGRADEAAEALRGAIDIAPDYCPAHREFSIVHKYRAGDPHIDEMAALAARDDFGVEDRTHLAFGRAKAFDDIDAREEAFECWREGNRLRFGQIGYDADHENKRFALIKTLFSEHALPPLAFEPIPYRPIFIVGMPRSGTSLCEEILQRHPEVWGAGELESMRRAVSHAGETHGRQLSQDMIRDVRRRYLLDLKEIDAPHGVVTDKMPANFRFTGFIRLAFPEAKVIDMRRSPAAVCWSLYRSYFSVHGLGYAYDMEAAADYFNHYQSLMTLLSGLWPGTIHTQSYEALTEDPETEVRRLLQACDLPFDPSCLDAKTSTRAVRTTSALQVRGAIYKGSSDAWRRYEAQLQPMLARLSTHGLAPPSADIPH